MYKATKYGRAPRTILIGMVLLLASGAAFAGTPISNGYRDFSYSGGNSTPAGEKPESKLWWNDGAWWGSLYSTSVGDYRIYRFDPTTQGWSDAGTTLDGRGGSKADTLWDSASQKLYVVSHPYTSNGAYTTSSSNWGRLYRYSYNAASQTYSLDTGYPVNINNAKSEALVIDKDSSGRLWVTWVQGGKVMVNHSLQDDRNWSVPMVLPASSDTVTVATDDISSLIAFGGDKIGVMWSNQLTKKMYFAVHLDSDPPEVWQQEEVALAYSSDDHINLKTDAFGRVYAAVKTSLTVSTDPLVVLLVRSIGGAWADHVFGTVKDHHTRPIVLLDEESGRIYMFATRPEAGGSVYYKSTELGNILFAAGWGEPFLKSATDLLINNPSSTKQNVNSTTGLLVIGDDRDKKYYFHNYLSLAPTAPAAAASARK